MDEKRYYTAKEAMERLGMPKSTFYTKVQDGLIPKILPPNRQRGAVFSVDEIDRIAGTSVAVKSPQQEDTGRTFFRRALPQDAQGMYELSQRVMERSGGYGIPAEKRLTYLSKLNSEVGHILQRDGKMLGFFTILPLKHDLLLRLMRNEVRASQIPLDDYVRLAPGERIDCFVWEIMADPDNKYLSAHLINKMLKFFHTLGKRGVEIEGMYAKATSPEGMDLSRKLGMQEMQMSKELQLDYVPFEMKIQQTRNRFTKNYLQALRSYRNRASRKI